MKKILVSSLLSLFANCLSMPVTANLPEPEYQVEKIKEEIILEKVKIPVLEGSQKTSAEDNLTVNLKSYLESGNYFEKVHLFLDKENAKPTAKTFEFQFNQYSIVRKPYAWYFPLALVTLTFYIWFGGTIAIDHINMETTLQVRDAKNKIVFEKKLEVNEQRDIDFYTSERFFPNSSSARGKLFAQILKDYKLSRKE